MTRHKILLLLMAVLITESILRPKRTGKKDKADTLIAAYIRASTFKQWHQ